ncbi:zinc-dependent metalloprotease [Spirulina sp. CS-785/01]|uniref:zinc-dependent metalloprotease n=1 Tax=Spirulina sp. CS-785/01 TaxID=3021716 RepID=UPI00232DE356|nr:zinc-dependent metalloprotease [Spirulina sp. CS-785/01]MDB9313113.1 zinc-dependent metalloprotease [Spirulina sp. CS-785/01]
MKKVRIGLHFLLGLLFCLGLSFLNPPLPTTASTPESEANFLELVEQVPVEYGLFTLYHDREVGHYYLEIQPDQLNQNYLCIPSLSQGIGEGDFVNGLAGNSFLFQFRRVNDQLQFVIPNTYFRTRPDDPQEANLDQSFSDSVLYSLPILATHPERQSLFIDLNELLLRTENIIDPHSRWGLNDDLLSSYQFDKNKSYLSQGRAYPQNIELEAVYGFSLRSGESPVRFSNLPDNRAFNLSIHYSIAQLPQNNGYVPRLADERVGYFITAYKNLSNLNERDLFVRYIERWHLEPQNPNAELSPPKDPLVFWLDNTIPHEYRETVREGILMWNAAFEQAGFIDAIEVRQMPDHADWSPEDIRYNTIRWSNSTRASFGGIGPRRVNPLTGEILSADVIIVGNVLQSKVEDYEAFFHGEQALGCRGDGETPALFSLEQLAKQDICFALGAGEQLALGVTSLSVLQDEIAPPQEKEKFIRQYLRWLVAHEVGHILGLRHNFHGSTLLTTEELHNPAITRSRGLVSSVMDYVGVNLAPDGVEQGDYFPTLVGPYDRWAIEYGYKPSGVAVPFAERRFLDQIAQRASQRELAYATDEDYWGFNDPYVNTWDLGENLLEASQMQMENALVMWERLQKRYPVQEDSYSEVRDKFNEILGHYFRQARFVARFIGGRSFDRVQPRTGVSRPPFEQIPVEKQRKALTILAKYVFSDEYLVFPPQLLNQLAPSRWNHWEDDRPRGSLDYPIHEIIVVRQFRILRSLLSGDRLSLLRNNELKTDDPKSILTMPELYETLKQNIWSEVVQEGGQNISTLRRSLQRIYVKMLVAMVLDDYTVPEDAQTLAWYQLRELKDAIGGVLRHHGRGLDIYTKAHLEETRDRITKTLDARYERVF